MRLAQPAKGGAPQAPLTLHSSHQTLWHSPLARATQNLTTAHRPPAPLPFLLAQCDARSYMMHTLDSTENAVNNDKIFTFRSVGGKSSMRPSGCLDHPSPQPLLSHLIRSQVSKKALGLASNQLKRLYRILAHAHYHHETDLKRINVRASQPFPRSWHTDRKIATASPPSHLLSPFSVFR